MAVPMDFVYPELLVSSGDKPVKRPPARLDTKRFVGFFTHVCLAWFTALKHPSQGAVPINLKGFGLSPPKLHMWNAIVLAPVAEMSFATGLLSNCNT
eukprot:2215046-Alexandrium_andersonii.AAC.1